MRDSMDFLVNLCRLISILPATDHNTPVHFRNDDKADTNPAIVTY
jgi:hypothetical protein